MYCWEFGYGIVVSEYMNVRTFATFYVAYTHTDQTDLIHTSHKRSLHFSNRSWKRSEADLWQSSFSFQSRPSGVCESRKRSHSGLDHLCSGVAPWRRSNLSSFQGLCPSCPSVLISSLSASPYETCPVFPSHKNLLPGI